MKSRLATIDDIPLIENLAGKAFPDTYAEILAPEQIEYMMDMMYSAKSLREQISGAHTFYVIYADDGATPCGYVSIEAEGADSFHLQKIYILSQYRGTGAGAFAFETAVAHIKRVHPAPCKMLLNVNRENLRAQKFYAKHGMKKVSQGDFDIGRGYFMNDYIFVLDIK